MPQAHTPFYSRLAIKRLSPNTDAAPTPNYLPPIDIRHNS